MYWLDNNTGISTAPTTPAVISLTKRFFTNGGAGEQPSIPEDFWFNMVQEELLGVLTMAGIAPVKNDLGQLAKAIQSIAFSAYPVGAPIPWPTAVPPAGFLAMEGQAFNPSLYPKLAAAYPSGVLEEMRAEFIRGWDGTRGVDPGRSILSSQSNAIQSHSHSWLHRSFSAIGTATSPAGPESRGPAYSGSDLGGGSLVTGFSGGSETRPRNKAFYYIVRAA